MSKTPNLGQKPSNADVSNGYGFLIGLIIFGLIVWFVWPKGKTSPRGPITIGENAATNPMERWAAETTVQFATQDCEKIEIVTPSTSEPGGYIIDCVNGDRYRIHAGEKVPRFDRRWRP